MSAEYEVRNKANSTLQKNRKSSSRSSLNEDFWQWGSR